MIMKDTTAVEFLAKSLKDFPHIKHSFRFRELVEQAKAMEKKQIENAYKVEYGGEKHMVVNILEDGSPVLVPMSVINEECFAVDLEEIVAS